VVLIHSERWLEVVLVVAESLRFLYMIQYAEQFCLFILKTIIILSGK